MNIVTLIGRTTKEIQIKQTTTGKSYAKFTLAVNRDKEHTDFINCVAWDKLADTIVKYVNKGDQLGVKGSITTSQFKKEDGTNVYNTEVLCERIYLLANKKEKTETSLKVSDIQGEELPFM